MAEKAPEMLVFRDLIAEMDAYSDMAVDSFFSEEAAVRFKKCIKEVEDWQPEDEPSFEVQTNGLFAAIIAAYSLHSVTMLHEANGNGEAAAEAFWKAQDFLRKAVTTLQLSVQHAAGITREVATSPSTTHTIQ
jgi:hypothetical protein